MDQLCASLDGISLRNEHANSYTPKKKDITSSGKKSVRPHSWVVSPSPSFIRSRADPNNRRASIEKITSNQRVENVVTESNSLSSMEKTEVEKGVMEACQEVALAVTIDGNDTTEKMNFLNRIKKPMNSKQKQAILSEIEINPAIPPEQRFL